jgi:hypothetical protein
MLTIIGTSIGAVGLCGGIYGYNKCSKLISKKKIYAENIVPYEELASFPHMVNEFIMEYKVPDDSHSKIHHILEQYIKTTLKNSETLEYSSGVKIAHNGIKPIYDARIVTTTKEIPELATRTVELFLFGNLPNVYQEAVLKIFINSFSNIPNLEVSSTHDFDSLRRKLWKMNGYKLPFPDKNHLFYKHNEYRLACQTIYVNAKKNNNRITFSTISANAQDIANDKFNNDIKDAATISIAGGLLTIASGILTTYAVLSQK